MYRIIGGASNGTCYTFDDDMPLSYCEQFTKGGWEGPGGCVGSSLLPMSVAQKNPIPYIFYSEKNCEGTSEQTISTCVDGSSLGISNWKSFSCTVSIYLLLKTKLLILIDVCYRQMTRSIFWLMLVATTPSQQTSALMTVAFIAMGKCLYQGYRALRNPSARQKLLPCVKSFATV